MSVPRFNKPTTFPPPAYRLTLRAALIWMAVAAVVVAGLIYFRASTLADSARALARAEARSSARSLELQMTAPLVAADTLALFVRQSGGRVNDFQAIAAGQLTANPSLSVLEVMPSGVVSDVVPRAGRQGVIGLNAFKDPARRTGATLAWQRRIPSASGPLRLAGGEPGVLVQAPVFVPGRDGRYAFWGLVSAGVRLDTLLASSGLHELARHGYDYALFSPAQNGQPAATFASSGQPTPSESVQEAVRLPNLDLRLVLRPQSGWHSVGDLVLSCIAGIIGLACLGAALWASAQRRDALASADDSQAQLTRSRDRFRAFLEVTTEAMIITDRAGRIQSANAPAERMFGYRREEMVGQPVELLVPSRARASHLVQRERYQRTPDHRAMGAGLELAAVRKGGAEFPVEVTLCPLPGETALEPLICSVVRDLTEKQRLDSLHRRAKEDQQRKQAEWDQFRAESVREHEELEELRDQVEALEENLAAVTHQAMEASAKAVAETPGSDAPEQAASLESDEPEPQATTSPAPPPPAEPSPQPEPTPDSGAPASGPARTSLPSQELAAQEAGAPAQAASSEPAEPEPQATTSPAPPPPAEPSPQPEPTTDPGAPASGPARTSLPSQELAAPEAGAPAPRRKRERREEKPATETKPTEAPPPPPAPEPEPPAKPVRQPKRKKPVQDDQMGLFGSTPEPEPAPAPTTVQPVQAVSTTAASPASTPPPSPAVENDRPPWEAPPATESSEPAAPSPEPSPEPKPLPKRRAAAEPESAPAPAPSPAKEPELPALDGLDLKAGLRHAEGSNRQFINNLLQFQTEFTGAAEELRDQLVQGETVSAGQLAAALRKAAERIGAAKVTANAEALERAIAKPADPTEIEWLWADLDQALGPLLRDLKRSLKPVEAQSDAEPPAVATRGEMRKALHEILPLLAESDPGAAECMEANHEVMRALFTAEAFPRFKELVKSSGFAEALDLLRKAAKKHGL